MSIFGSAPKQKVSQSEIALAEVSLNQWNDKRRFDPVRDRFLENIETTDGERAQAGGMANADVAMSAAPLNRGTIRAGLGAGGGLGSGRVIGGLHKNSLDIADASGRAITGAIQGADDNEVAGRLKMAAFGRGLADDATTSTLGAAKRASTEAAQRLQNKVTSRNGLFEGVGAVVGAVGEHNNWWGLGKNKLPATKTTNVKSI